MQKIGVSLILVLLFVTGCAVSKVSETDLTKLKTSKIATSFLIAEKKLHYREVLYRVLWLDTKTASMDFSGAWDLELELSNLVNESVVALDIDSYEISDIITENNVLSMYRAGLKKDYISNSPGQNKVISATALHPTDEYFLRYPEYDEFDRLRKHLLDKGVSYLFEFLSPYILGHAPGYGLVFVTMPTQIRIIDLNNKSVIWTVSDFAVKTYQLGGDLMKLEENNLAKLKEAITYGMNRILAKERLGTNIGLIKKQQQSSANRQNDD